MNLIEIQGNPTAWQRAGICKGRVFDRQMVKRRALQWQMKAAYSGEPLKGPIELSCEFIFQPAASASKTKKAAMNGRAHTQRPDADNLLKLIADCGNGVLWGDDCQLACVMSKKIWGRPARTIIHFQEIPEVKP
jgi:Holliday junction resolvase RusA-like endonuclease